METEANKKSRKELWKLWVALFVVGLSYVSIGEESKWISSISYASTNVTPPEMSKEQAQETSSFSSPVSYKKDSTQSNWKSHCAWPQQNDNLHQAIRQGHRFGVQDQTSTEIDENSNTYLFNERTKCKRPIKGLATIVTAYYDIPSKHPTSRYEKWIPNLLQASDPMVIFIDPTSDYKNWWPTIEKQRQHAPTLLIAWPWSNLTMNTVFTDEFWNTYILPRDGQDRFRKGPDVYKIWNEKIILMRETARVNPFDTEFLYWMDAGYFRQVGWQCTSIIRNNITEKGVNPKTQLVYQMVKDYPSYEIAGGAWGGTPEAIQVHYKQYWRTFWYLVLYSDKECPGYEQRVLVWMCRSVPELCVIHKSQRANLSWFSMGQSWLRDADYEFTKNHPVTIPRLDNTTRLPPLTKDFELDFPPRKNSSSSAIGLLPEIPPGKVSTEGTDQYKRLFLMYIK